MFLTLGEGDFGMEQQTLIRRTKTLQIQVLFMVNIVCRLQCYFLICLYKPIANNNESIKEW